MDDDDDDDDDEDEDDDDDDETLESPRCGCRDGSSAGKQLGSSWCNATLGFCRALRTSSLKCSGTSYFRLLMELQAEGPWWQLPLQPLRNWTLLSALQCAHISVCQ